VEKHIFYAGFIILMLSKVRHYRLSHDPGFETPRFMHIAASAKTAARRINCVLRHNLPKMT